MTRGIVLLALLCPACDSFLGLEHVPNADAAPSESIDALDAGPFAPCSLMSMLADNFDANDDAKLAVLFPGRTAGTHEVNGYVQMDLSNGSTMEQLGTTRYFDMRESRVSVALTIGPGFGSADTVGLYLTSARAGFGLIMVVENLQLKFYRIESGQMLLLGSVAYNPASQLYWRISNHANVTYFETSPDGQTYHIETMYPGLDYVTFMTVDVIAARGIGSGGWVVTLDDVNGGTPVGSACQTSVITDDFSAGTFGERWSRTRTSANAAVSEHDGISELKFLADGGGAFVYMIPTTPMSMISDAYTVETVQMIDITAGSNEDFQMQVYAFEGDAATFGIGNAMLVASRSIKGSIGLVIGNKPYDPVAQRWLRIRESGGIVYWETSPDGKTFDLVTTNNELAGLDRTDMSLVIEGVPAVPDAAKIDNFNLPPS